MKRTTLLAALTSLVLCSIPLQASTGEDESLLLDNSTDLVDPPNRCGDALATLKRSPGRNTLSFVDSEFEKLYSQVAASPSGRRMSREQLKAAIQKEVDRKAMLFPGGLPSSANLTITVSCSWPPLSCTITVSF